MVKHAATEVRRVSEIAMFLLVEADPRRGLLELPLELPLEVAVGVDPEVEDPVEELRPLASWAKPTAAGLARKTEYTFFRNVSPIIQVGTLEPLPILLPISKIPPAHI